jgi:hypothetical protein
VYSVDGTVYATQDRADLTGKRHADVPPGQPGGGRRLARCPHCGYRAPRHAARHSASIRSRWPGQALIAARSGDLASDLVASLVPLCRDPRRMSADASLALWTTCLWGKPPTPTSGRSRPRRDEPRDGAHGAPGTGCVSTGRPSAPGAHYWWFRSDTE